MKSQSLKVMGIRQWLVLGMLSILGSLGAIATPVRAETRQLDFTISSYSNQTFPELMRQAESLAENSIKQAFAEKADVTEVSVRIIGERNGEQAPILSVTVSRSSWQTQPRIQRWTKFGNSELLLGFLQTRARQSAPSPPAFDEVSASQSDREPNFYR